MCALPARSIPGSEMLLVEKTRIFGFSPGIYLPRLMKSCQ